MWNISPSKARKLHPVDSWSTCQIINMINRTNTTIPQVVFAIFYRTDLDVLVKKSNPVFEKITLMSFLKFGNIAI